MKLSSKIFLFCILFLGVEFLFLREVFLMKQTFNLGDYGAQHYPWAEFYAKGIKNFKLPLWCPLIHAGFPLFAEGQIGAMYPLNIILFLLLPFELAYNLNILLHFFLGGLFIYVYLRSSLKLSIESSLLASIVWIFGSAYAGVEYNLIAMKVLIWLPLTFYFVDKIIHQKNRPASFLLGFIFAFQMVAGYIQFAFYSLFFTILYFLFLSFLNKKDIKHGLEQRLLFGFSLLLGGGLSAIQLLPSIELTRESVRFIGGSIDFAMVDSFSPLAFFSFFFPYPTGILQGVRTYLGSISIFFVILAFYRRKHHHVYPLIFGTFALLAFLFSLGRVNPFYVGFISLFKLYFFRSPMKWSFFLCFFFSLLVGIGFDVFIKEFKEIQRSKRMRQLFLLIPMISIGIFFFSIFALDHFGHLWIRLGRSYVDHFIYGKAFHHLSKEAYNTKLLSVFEALRASFSLNLYNMGSMFFLMISGGFFYFVRTYSYRKIQIGVFCLIILDLYLFSFYGTGLRGNMGAIERTPQIETMVQNSLDRSFMYVDASGEGEARTIFPNENMRLGLSFLGAYSPLVTKGLASYLSEAGGYNDSIHHFFSDAGTFERNLSLLSVANVKYVYSSKKLSFSGLSLLKQTKDKNFIYLNEAALPRAYYVSKATYVPRDQMLEVMRSKEFRFKEEVLLEEKTICDQSVGGGRGEIVVKKYENQNLEFLAKAEQPGWVVLSDLYYPGWKAWVDGEEVSIHRANFLFRALFLTSGEHQIKFLYQPKSFKIGAAISMVTFCFCLLALLFF